MEDIGRDPEVEDPEKDPAEVGESAPDGDAGGKSAKNSGILVESETTPYVAP